ncbi:hypothetical protein PEBR_00503 [Penicillium brasilianum]|uniref:ML-like domain-containing protein n=1 Tax=Penicillium brasilianum TaxID=104259 RepID=A0A1S9S0S9_PENBI|nr:hypothetical protein PEBR_00503 [Penicillium brasilianum]
MLPAPWCPRGVIGGVIGALYFAGLSNAVKLLESSALVSCSDTSIIETSKFEMTLTPGNASLAIEFDGELTYSGKVIMDVSLLVYGYSFLTAQMDPCDYDLSGFCPMTPENLTMPSTTITLSDSVISSIPSEFVGPSDEKLDSTRFLSICVPQLTLSILLGIAYMVPDLDAIVRVNLLSKSTNQTVACIEARITNSSTVYQAAISWTLAVITGLSLFASTLLSILGYDNIATQVLFRTLLFLGFIQSQAIAGLAAVDYTPLIQSWTQNLQWTMSIVYATFLNTMTTWFQRATGGTASYLISEADDISIGLLRRSTDLLVKRSDTTSDGAEVLLHGIVRMGYIAGIDSTNIFMTGYLIFYFIAIFMLLAIMALKFASPAILNKIYGAKAYDALKAQVDWQTFLRENVCRIAYLGFPQACVFCMWELYRRDSAAEVVLAITLWLVMTIILGNATFRGFRSFGGFRYVRLWKDTNKISNWSPYTNQTCQSKWGYLYILYRAEAYYFVAPLLLYTVLKGMVIAFTQNIPLAQAIALLIIEAAFLVSTAVIRPYFDKKSNGFAITAAALNFVNGIFILMFTDAFNQPDLMTGIMSVLFFFYNAIFTLVLLIFLLIGLFYACQLKELASGWQPLPQNRASAHSTNQLLQADDRGSIELLSPHQEEMTTGELWRSQRPHPPTGKNLELSVTIPRNSSTMPSESLWNVDHGHDGITYNVRHSAAPPSPFAHPVEPTLPKIHIS